MNHSMCVQQQVASGSRKRFADIKSATTLLLQFGS